MPDKEKDIAAKDIMASIQAVKEKIEKTLAIQLRTHGYRTMYLNINGQKCKIEVAEGQNIGSALAQVMAEREIQRLERVTASQQFGDDIQKAAVQAMDAAMRKHSHVAENA